MNSKPPQDSTAVSKQQQTAYRVADELYLWWLVNPAAPRWVGTLRLVQRTAVHPGGVSLEYADSWLAAGGEALSEDLPLQPGEFMPVTQDAAAGAVDDARPDRWGERVIRFLDRPARLSTLEYLYFAGDERFGALGVSTSAAQYAPRWHGAWPGVQDLQTMHDVMRKVDAGEPVDERLRRLVTPGATLGGARPKALIRIDGELWLIKFAEMGDYLDSPLIEHASMTLAAKAGIAVCQTRVLRHASGHAIVVRRFDRHGKHRLHALTAHVALRAAGQDYGYPELALLLRRRGDAALIKAHGEELFRRMVFNILIDNTDDHEKNHALLVTPASSSASGPQRYTLAPAYDVLPSGQALGYQQMRVGKLGAQASIDNALSEAASFGLTKAHAQAVAAGVAQVVNGWREHFAACGVSERDIAALAQQIDRDHLLAQRDQAGGI
jgi:serine/threonine-protein kinase HipA